MTSARPTAVLTGLQLPGEPANLTSYFNPLRYRPGYKAALTLPLPERVTHLRDPETKRRILGEQPEFDDPELAKAMGAEVNRRIEGVRAAAGPSGEARMLVMAALLMADDVFDLRNKLQAAQAATGAPKADPKLGRKLNRMAKRAEEIAEGLEGRGAQES